MASSSPAWVFFVLAVVMLLGPLVAERVRLPGVIGLVVGGLVVGDQGLDLLQRAGPVEVVGGVGLLYLMFLAGLELDLDVLERHRRSAFGFGLLTFAIPITMGTTAALVLGFEVPASVLIGSLWASHTLVAYPIVRRHGLAADPAVAATVGATVITDTLALLVLAVIAGSVESGGLGWGLLLRLGPGLLLLIGFTVWILPRLAAWFFRGLGQERVLRFLFVLAGFLSASVLAELVGVEGIVGAFMAGLALNRLVPNGGALMQRVEFVGSALLIPIFLVSVGMLIDLRVVSDPETIGLAAVFTGVAIAGKWLAAWIAGRLFGFGRTQVTVMFSLSAAQAAATLAATVVAFELGLFGEQVVNAVLVVILVTVVLTSWSANRASPRVERADAAVGKIGRSVVVPIANPGMAPNLVRLAVRIARADGGSVLPLHAVTSTEPDRILSARMLMADVEVMLRRLGDDVEGLVRVDSSVASAVVHTVSETDASLVLVGWKLESTARDRLLGTVLDELVGRAPAPVAAAWLPQMAFERIVLDLGGLAPASPDATVASQLAATLQRSLGIPLVLSPESGDHIRPGWTLLDGPLDGSDLLVVGGTMRAGAARDLVEANPGLGLVVVSSAAGSGGVPEVQDLFRAR